MPTYDYVCSACGHELEIFHSMTEAPRRKCPACRRMKLERRIGTGAGILFKGSGFYATDYRSKSYRDAAKSEKKSAETAAKSESSKPTSSTGDGPKKSSESKRGDSGGSSSGSDA